MIQNLIFGILFENIISGTKRFYIRPDIPVDIRDFLSESLKANKN